MPNVADEPDCCNLFVQPCKNQAMFMDSSGNKKFKKGVLLKKNTQRVDLGLSVEISAKFRIPCKNASPTLLLLLLWCAGR